MASSDQNIGTTFNKNNTEDQKKLFNNYFDTQINFTPSEVDAVIGYFLKRGFEQVAAVNTASVLLQQAEIDEVPVFQLLDTIKGTNEVELKVSKKIRKKAPFDDQGPGGKDDNRLVVNKTIS